MTLSQMLMQHPTVAIAKSHERQPIFKEIWTPSYDRRLVRKFANILRGIGNRVFLNQSSQAPLRPFQHYVILTTPVRGLGFHSPVFHLCPHFRPLLSRRPGLAERETSTQQISHASVLLALNLNPLSKVPLSSHLLHDLTQSHCPSLSLLSHSWNVLCFLTLK